MPQRQPRCERKASARRWPLDRRKHDRQQPLALAHPALPAACGRAQRRSTRSWLAKGAERQPVLHPRAPLRKVAEPLLAAAAPAALIRAGAAPVSVASMGIPPTRFCEPRTCAATATGPVAQASTIKPEAFSGYRGGPWLHWRQRGVHPALHQADQRLREEEKLGGGTGAAWRDAAAGPQA